MSAGRPPRVVLAIDGPAGSGKSTVAAALAVRLGVPHVDTGAYYRAATLAVLRAGADTSDPAAALAAVSGVEITTADGRARLDGVDVEAEIRGPAVTAAVSAVAAHPPVRAALLAAQRAGLDARGGVVEGRDAGTVVVPEAVPKVWLTAPVAERAVRRAAQGGQDSPRAIADEVDRIAARDAADARQMARASDVVEVDTSGCDVHQVVDRVAALVAETRPGVRT